jgi:Swiss Army Knife protein, DSP-PTPase phosphatase domain
MPALDVYSVAEGMFGGAYPGAADAARAPQAVAALERREVTLFLDLTVDGELPPYAHLLRRARHERRPIPDMNVPSPATMTATLDLIDEEIAAGGRVYVHCYGGVGRTGTVVGCWLQHHGLGAGDPIGRIAALRQAVHTSWMRSPQTEEQRRMVLEWPQDVSPAAGRP